jgi:hypothetical protein
VQKQAKVNTLNAVARLRDKLGLRFQGRSPNEAHASKSERSHSTLLRAALQALFHILSDGIPRVLGGVDYNDGMFAIC